MQAFVFVITFITSLWLSLLIKGLWVGPRLSHFGVFVFIYILLKSPHHGFPHNSMFIQTITTHTNTLLDTNLYYSGRLWDEIKEMLISCIWV